MKKVEIEIPEGKEIKWINGVLTLVDEKPQDITERIKTFGDACNVLGDDHPLVKEYRAVAYNRCIKIELNAYLKLRIICAALNEGWEPTFGEYEYRYYPWFNLYSKDEYDKLNKDEEGELRVAARSNNNSNVNVKLVYLYVNYSGLETNAGIGARLCLKTRVLAEYCGKQFIDIWADFLFG